MRKTPFLFLIILLEGYVVLAVELLAIRQLIPFVGSGTEVVSIIISAVLLPLAAGYYRGGKIASQGRGNAKRSLSLRGILLRNLLSSLVILVFGLSYVVQELYFTLLDALGTHSRIVQTALYSLTFLVTPVFMLAQTVPLISNYFGRARLSAITGRMLFFSTTGSFLGSVFSTLVLMQWLGVHTTVNVTLTLIGFLIVLITPRWAMFDNIMAVALVCIVWTINGDAAMKKFQVVADTPYNLMTLTTDKNDVKTLMLNRSMSSLYARDPHARFTYIRYIEEHFLAGPRPLEILVLGAGGFTLGVDDRINHYHFVDIDPALKTVAEQRILPSALPATKRFTANSARAFLRGNQQRYDLIVIDLYSNVISIPMEAVTREFLLDVKRSLAPGGIVIANIIASPNYSDRFTVRYANTFRSVFPVFDRQAVEAFKGFSTANRPINTLFIYYDTPFIGDREIYTDDKNRYSFDRN